MIQAIGWLAATILLLLFEASTFNLVSIWFAAGSAAALITCLFTGSLRVQSAVFVAVSILCLLALRPLTARLRRPLTPTNGDLNVGRTATILTPVTDDAPGRARLDGVDWNAQAVPGAAFAPGEKFDLSYFKRVLCAGRPLSPSYLASVAEHTAECFSLYGEEADPPVITDGKVRAAYLAFSAMARRGTTPCTV